MNEGSSAAADPQVWLVRRGGVVFGPLQAGEVELRIARGSLDRDTEVRRVTDDVWRALASEKAFEAALAARATAAAAGLAAKAAAPARGGLGRTVTVLALAGALVCAAGALWVARTRAGGKSSRGVRVVSRDGDTHGGRVEATLGGVPLAPLTVNAGKPVVRTRSEAPGHAAGAGHPAATGSAAPDAAMAAAPPATQAPAAVPAAQPDPTAAPQGTLVASAPPPARPRPRTDGPGDELLPSAGLPSAVPPSADHRGGHAAAPAPPPAPPTERVALDDALEEDVVPSGDVPGRGRPPPAPERGAGAARAKGANVDAETGLATPVSDAPSDDQLVRAIDSTLPSLNRCFARYLAHDHIRGELVLEFVVRTDGRVGDVDVHSPDLPPSSSSYGPLLGCLSHALATIKFKAFSGEARVVRYPFTIE